MVAYLSALVEGMQRVSEFDRELQLTTVICSNSRRMLQKASDLLTANGLKVLASYKRKKIYMVRVFTSFVLLFISHPIRK